MDQHVLNEDHNRQLAEYMRFLKRKREGAVSEAIAEVNAIRETRLFDDNYTVDDVAAILDGLVTQQRSALKQDLQTVSFSSVLLFKQICEQAEAAGVTLTTNLAATEDRALLAAVEDWEHSIQGGGIAPSLSAKAAVEGRKATRALPVIGQTQDPKLLSELQNARDDVGTLQERFNRLQVECSAALRDKSDLQAALDAAADPNESAALRAEIDDLRAALDQQQQATAAGGGASDQLLGELQRAQEDNGALAAECDALRAELTQRVERSQQFLNMRQMLSKKNNVVRALREQLQAHGIQPEGDVDAQDD